MMARVLVLGLEQEWTTMYTEITIPAPRILYKAVPVLPGVAPGCTNVCLYLRIGVCYYRHFGGSGFHPS